MNRVHKRFAKKIGKGLFNAGVFVTIYIALASVIGGIVWLVTGSPEVSFLVGTLFPAFAGLAFVIIKDVWDDSRREVEQENRRLMNDIKGNDY